MTNTLAYHSNAALSTTVKCFIVQALDLISTSLLLGNILVQIFGRTFTSTLLFIKRGAKPEEEVISKRGGGGRTGKGSHARAREIQKFSVETFFLFGFKNERRTLL